MNELLLIGVAFVSSTFTAIIGIGGGLLLISLMPGFLPIAAVVPVHGAVQIASNVSRASFAYREIKWAILAPYSLGVVLGAMLGAPMVGMVPPTYVPVLLGLFIILVTWLPVAGLARRRRRHFFPVGTIQSFLSLFVGATGPLSAPFLLHHGFRRDQVVATHAAMISVLHLVKTACFLMLGVVFYPYLVLMLGMMISMTFGSYVGTRLRAYVPEKGFRMIFKVAITLLGLRLLLSGL
jgi:uncharacterized membrane protein YfcA